MIDPFVVWTPTALVTAVIGGTLVGLLVVSRFENPRFDARQSALIVTGLGSFAGGVFYAGQAVDAAFADGPGFGWRVVSRFLLFVVFVACMGIGTGIGMRR